MAYYIRKNGVTKKLAVIPEGYPAELIGYDNTGTNLQSDNAQDAITELDSGKVSKSGDTMSGLLNIYNTSENQARFARVHSDTTSQPSRIILGNDIADGTSGSSYGRIRIYGKTANFAHLQATNLTANRTIELPNGEGTLALAGDVVAKTGDTMTGALNVTPSSEEVIWCCKNHSYTASKLSEITVGNTKADGTEGASHGGLILFGKSNRYVLLQATDIDSSNKTIELPNASGTLALLGDLTSFGNIQFYSISVSNTVTLSTSIGRQMSLVTIRDRDSSDCLVGIWIAGAFIQLTSSGSSISRTSVSTDNLVFNVTKRYFFVSVLSTTPITITRA